MPLLGVAWITPSPLEMNCMSPIDVTSSTSSVLRSHVHSVVLEAEEAAPGWALAAPDTRADLLCALATALEAARSSLVVLAHKETHLGAQRLSGELDRTCFQLRALAGHVAGGSALKAQDDQAVALPPPMGRPRTTRVKVPLGPVAVFAASNFPFAFSVLGGDTASALAVGCPVILRAHPAHPRLSRAVFNVAHEVIRSQRLPRGLLGMVLGDATELGIELVRHPAVQAVAFTGSRQGGLALQAITQKRTPPIPFFGELGSVNPIVVLPGALVAKIDEMAAMLAQSVTLGMGQFCTRPSLLVLSGDENTTPFLEAIASRLGQAPTHPMLSPRIAAGFVEATRHWARKRDVAVLVGSSMPVPGPFMARVDAETFLGDPSLSEEVFGPALLAVVCHSSDTMSTVMAAAGGSLVHTLWGANEESPLARSLVKTALHQAGRVVFEGVPTGVAVTAAQQHGGPWPASTEPSSTSVGHHACDRFVRPVALQQAPGWVLAQYGQSTAINPLSRRSGRPQTGSSV